MPGAASRRPATTGRTVLPVGRHNSRFRPEPWAINRGAIQGPAADSSSPPRMHRGDTRTGGRHVTPESRHEIVELAERLCAGPITDDEAGRLNQLLRDNAESQG